MRRIFIIGPMSDATGKPLENTYNIKAALEGIFRDHGGPIEIKLDIPEELYGSDIPRDVFTAIDLSDLVIADISHRSPSVMYELAFAHALGIPTMLIDKRDAAASDPQADLIGNINRIYGAPGYVEPSRNYRGTYGFITD